MTHNAHLPSIPEIYKLLNTLFDDVELDTFCLGYFPHIYDKFSEGMRKDKKLNLLLDYCRRSGCLHSLVRVIYLWAEAKGINIEKIQEKIYLRAALPYQTALACRFDLIEQLDSCLNTLWGKKGVIGFAVACGEPVFLKHLCERVKYELGRDRVRLMPPLVINSIRSNIEHTIRMMKRRYKAALKEHDVLFTVQVPDKKFADRFWKRLRHAAEDDKLINRLIVIMTISPDCSLPEELIPLKAPNFGVADVMRWVRRVVNELTWPEYMFDYWTKHMMIECSYEDKLQVEWVYDHLDAMLNLLKQNPSIQDFQEELEKRRQIYV